jgi:predicted  nucleic acid-binding Zn-ribbon protein
MSERLEKIAAEITKARKRKAAAETKVKELEDKYREAKNVEIQDIVAKADLSPDALAVLIERSRKSLPQTDGNRLGADGIISGNETKTEDEG